MEILSPAANRVGVCADNLSSLGHDPELARLHAQVASLQAEREALRYAAGHDELTGLPNRRLFYTLAPPRLGNSSAAVIVIDLDGFKPINDRHDHAAGDHVLRIVAYRLASWAGGNLIARLGGDEFAALLCAPGNACSKWWYPAVVALAAAIGEPIAVGGHTVAVTASIGIAPSSDRAPVGELLHQADMAMYQAKRHSKLTGVTDVAWAFNHAGAHETIPLRGTLAIERQPVIDVAEIEPPRDTTPEPAPVSAAEPASAPQVVELTIFAMRPKPDGTVPPTCGPLDRDPRTVVPESDYRAGDPVWVHRDGAWRPGIVEGASVIAVLVRYRCADGPGTGVDTLRAEYLARRTTTDPQFDRRDERLPKAA